MAMSYSAYNHKRKVEEMEGKFLKPDHCNFNGVGAIRYMRDVPPAHYTFKIKSYSLLSKTQVEKYECGDFESGGYKWRLSIYPNGDKTRDGDGYISVYLEISDADTFPLGWEVFVNLRLFVFNQIQDKYLTIQDDISGIRRFHGMKREWGFAQVLSLNTFNNASNGYLVKDSCIFGAEVFVIKCSGKWECLSMVKEPVNNTFTWKIDNFSTLHEESYDSEVFTVGEVDWKLSVCPKGDSRSKGKELSVFLEVDDFKNVPPNRKLYADFKIRIKDQVNGNHHECAVEHWFSADSESWGFDDNWLTLRDLNQATKGFLKNDTLIVEAQIIVMSTVEDFP